MDNTPNQSSKFRTRNWVAVNDDERGGYDINSQMKLKISMFKSRLCDYSEANILLKGTIKV